MVGIRLPLPRRLAEIGDDRLGNYALTALLVLESLLLFVALPLWGMGLRAPLLFGGSLGIPLVLSIVIISSSTGARLLGAVATGLAIGGVAFRINEPSLLAIWLGHLAVIAAVLALSLVISRAVFAPGRITHHRIEGGVILYLNIAIIFTSIYRLVAELDPAAFNQLSAHQSEAAAVSGMLYFSFTTLTSTGFGEILPVNPMARSMANLEAVLGQLYMVILLARLVTMHIETRGE